MISAISRSVPSRNSISVNGIFITILFALLALNCQAQTATKGGKVEAVAAKTAVTGNTYAIIFGISNYPGLTPLKYADKDAELFRDFLLSPAGGNTKPENVFFRKNESAKAADFNVAAWGWLKNKELKEGDRLYVYFSGHGDAANAANYFLLPYDCMPNNDVNNYLATGLIQMYNIKSLFIHDVIVKKKVEVILIIDACRTNDLAGGQEGQQEFAQSIAEQSSGEVMMLSAGGGQQAIESSKIGNGHGLFTWYLVAGLNGAADKEGDAADQDGKVSMAELTSYVKNHVRKDAKNIFNSNQVPVFLPPGKDLETIAVVDNASYQNWKLAENLRQQTSGTGPVMAAANTAGKKGSAATGTADTTLINLDNKFIAAIKSGRLSGENSAESFYNKMKDKWPDQSLTGDARYALASEFINFGQDKINLFLSGKGMVHIQRIENDFKVAKKGDPNKSTPPAIAEQIDRMRTLTITGFDKAAEMMDKAVKLLNTDPELLEQIYPKLYFLQAAAYDKVNNITGRRQAIILLKKAIKKDSTAAYNYLMLGHVYYQLKNDSCEAYFKKAISLAPKWAEPESDLANFYSEKKNKTLAILHYNKAIKLDSLDALAYQNIGVLYSNENKMDSAKYYFMKALQIDPCDHFANANMGYLNSTYMKSKSPADPNFKIAVKYFKKSISCDTSFARGYLSLSGLFNKVNLKDSSIYYLNQGIARNPNDSYLYRSLGDEYLEIKDTLKSEVIYKKALAIDSLDEFNALSLSWLYRNAAINDSKVIPGKMNAFGKAIFYSMKAIKVNPASKYGYEYLADVYLETKQFDKAVPQYQKVIQLDTAYVEAYNNLGNAYMYQHDFNNANNSYLKAIKLDPKSAYLYDNLGNSYFFQKDYTNAAINYKKAITLDSTYSNSYQKLGTIYTFQKDYPNAIAILNKGIRIDPTHAATFNALGSVHYDMKQYDKAIADQSKAVELAPTNAYYYCSLALAHDELGHDEDAIKYYKKSIAADSSFALPYADLGYIYKKQKQYDKAIACFKTAMLRSPNLYLLNNAIGSVYLELKDYNKEIYYFKKTLEADSTNDTYLNFLGFAYLYTKDYKSGIACLQKMLKLYPQDMVSYYNLARGYAISNNPEMSAQYLKTALDKGLKDYQYIAGDADLENLRKHPEYSALMKQYFPDKIK